MISKRLGKWGCLVLRHTVPRISLSTGTVNCVIKHSSPMFHIYLTNKPALCHLLAFKQKPTLFMLSSGEPLTKQTGLRMQTLS